MEAEELMATGNFHKGFGNLQYLSLFLFGHSSCISAVKEM